MSKEVERARLEAAGHREEKGRVEARADDLVRENRMLQDRLSDGKLRSRTRERDRCVDCLTGSPGAIDDEDGRAGKCEIYIFLAPQTGLLFARLLRKSVPWSYSIRNLFTP